MKVGVIAQHDPSLNVKDIPAQGQRLLRLKVAHLVNPSDMAMDLPPECPPQSGAIIVDTGHAN